MLPSQGLDNSARPAAINTICAFFPLAFTSHHSVFCIYVKTQTILGILYKNNHAGFAMF